MQSPTEEIKARLDIADLIGSYVQLKRAGANFKANCPFHSEKTASFMVSRPKQLWYCFGACREGGDIFKFVMKVEGLDFSDALKLLADKAGIELPKYDKRAESKKNTLLEIMKETVDLYSRELNSTRGAFAKEYLTRRGLTEAVAAQFKLGYAPDKWDTLISALRGKYKPQDAVDAGLIMRKQRSSTAAVRSSPPDSLDLQNAGWADYYDRFRHRVMFPIFDVHGSAVAFTSRLLDETRQEGKYVNSPETAIYSKSRILYGLNMARDTIRKADYAVIVEGNMDVIACHQFGMTNAVASSGTALTVDQIRLLKRYTGNLKIAFDADPAGQKAAARGIDAALSEGLRVKVITIPPGYGKDPDECVRKDMRVWGGAVRDAREIIEYHFERAYAKDALDNASGRAQFAQTLLTEIAKLPDAIEQDFWIKKLGETLRVSEVILREELIKQTRRPLRAGGAAAKGAENAPQPVGADLPRSRLAQMSERLLGLFFAAPAHGELILSSVLPEMLAGEEYRALYANLAACYIEYNSTSGSGSADPNFRQFWRKWGENKPPDILSTADILELYCDKEFVDWRAEQLFREIRVLISDIRRDHMRGRMTEIAEAMRAAEAQGDTVRVEALTREFSVLNSERRSADTPEVIK